MLFSSAVRHATLQSWSSENTWYSTFHIKRVLFRSNSPWCWVLWGVSGGMQHPPRPKKKPEGPHTVLTVHFHCQPAGDLNEGRSFLNEFRYIPFHSTRGRFLRAPIYSSSSSTSSFSLLYIFLYPLLQFIPPQNRHQPGL